MLFQTACFVAVQATLLPQLTTYDLARDFGHAPAWPLPRHHHVLRNEALQRVIHSGQPGVTPILAIRVDGDPAPALSVEDLQDGLVLYCAQSLAAEVSRRILSPCNEQLRWA